MKLLIVDDNATVRRILKNIIGQLAEEIYECDDGAEALAAYRRYAPEWVLMDIEMQQTDGLAATRQIKAANASAQIIIVTNYDSADLREAARQAGACAYVVKEDLFAVRAVLSAEVNHS